MRTLQDLLNVDQPAWPLVQQWIAEATNLVEVLPPNPRDRSTALVSSQITVRSPMGAVIYETGGLLVDHCFLRILGSGHPKLPRPIHTWNANKAPTLPDGRPGFFLIADDIVGGFFALDGGALGPGRGHVFYHAPDSLQWESLDEMTYSDFLSFAFTGDLDSFYKSFRWPKWKTESQSIPGDKSLSLYPPPFTVEGKNLAAVSRKPVPVSEIYNLYLVEYPKQFSSES
jgi:hypothetical protein